MCKVKIGTRWFTFKSKIAVRKFLCSAGFNADDLKETAYTLYMLPCQQVFTSAMGLTVMVCSKGKGI